MDLSDEVSHIILPTELLQILAVEKEITHE